MTVVLLGRIRDMPLHLQLACGDTTAHGRGGEYTFSVVVDVPVVCSTARAISNHSPPCTIAWLRRFHKLRMQIDAMGGLANHLYSLASWAEISATT